jgi:hypothetical protein
LCLRSSDLPNVTRRLRERGLQVGAVLLNNALVFGGQPGHRRYTPHRTSGGLPRPNIGCICCVSRGYRFPLHTRVLRRL